MYHSLPLNFSVYKIGLFYQGLSCSTNLLRLTNFKGRSPVCTPERLVGSWEDLPKTFQGETNGQTGTLSPHLSFFTALTKNKPFFVGLFQVSLSWPGIPVPEWNHRLGGCGKDYLDQIKITKNYKFPSSEIHRKFVVYRPQLIGIDWNPCLGFKSWLLSDSWSTVW